MEAVFEHARIITIFFAYIEKPNINVSALKIHVSPVTQSILIEFKTFQLEERGIIDVKVRGNADWSIGNIQLVYKSNYIKYLHTHGYIDICMTHDEVSNQCGYVV